MPGRTGELSILEAPANKSLVRARSLATLLDSSIGIPGTKRRIGLDPILGLVPFVGDFAGAILSGYIVLAAARAGVPTFTLIRMIGNIAVDTLVGSVPLLGDVLDAGWKSNTMNIALFERHVATTSTPGRSMRDVSRLSGFLLVVTSLLALALLTFVAALLILALKPILLGR